MTNCKIANCNKKVYTSGYCRDHCRTYVTLDNFEYDVDRGFCEVPGCRKIRVSDNNNLCANHDSQRPEILARKNKWQKENALMRKATLKKFNASEKAKKLCKNYRLTLNGRFKIFLKEAKRRQINVSLTFEEFAFLHKNGTSKCYYCGMEIISGSGLDRIDNTKGYFVGNLVPCCKYCNNLRGNLLTKEETEQVIKILKQLRKTDSLWQNQKTN